MTAVPGRRAWAGSAPLAARLAGAIPAGLALTAGLWLTAGPTTGTGAAAIALRPSAHAEGRVESQGLVVHLGARAPGPPGEADVAVRVVDRRARGAFGYDVTFGDGTAARNAVPLFCAAGPGHLRRARWHFPHRYLRPGTYSISVTVAANCTGVTATALVHLRVG